MSSSQSVEIKEKSLLALASKAKESNELKDPNLIDGNGDTEKTSLLTTTNTTIETTAVTKSAETSVAPKGSSQNMLNDQKQFSVGQYLLK